ncbi:MAG: SDR family NAD(P)-dependent oxidoreductase [Granulosicoccus sp.]
MQQPNYQPSTQTQKEFKPGEDALAGKVVLITGATGGLGTCLSIACAQAGATVALASRNEKKLEKLYDVIVDSGAEKPAIIPLQQDKAGPAEYSQLADLLTSEFGMLDALVHCSADLGTPTPQLNISHAEWVKVMNVNLTAARLLSLHCMPLLTGSEIGSITFLLDKKTTAYWGSYGVSKQALQTLMHMLADETDNKLGNDNSPLLAINGFDPGPIRTPLRRRAFPGEREDETDLPQTRLGPLLSLILRTDRKLTGAAVSF